MLTRKSRNAFKPSDDTIDITLDTARSLLNVGGELLSLAPIPGLEGAASALANVIGMIQVSVLVLIYRWTEEATRRTT